jgi:hypothetical protein
MSEWIIRIVLLIAGCAIGYGLALYIETRRMPW